MEDLTLEGFSEKVIFLLLGQLVLLDQSFFCHMVFSDPVLIPAMLIEMILNHSFPFIKLYLPQELFLCYSIC